MLAPPDLERIFGLQDGSIFQGEQGLDQMAFMRPIPELAHYSTPLPGLYLCGAGTHPGGGVMAAPATTPLGGSSRIAAVAPVAPSGAVSAPRAESRRRPFATGHRPALSSITAEQGAGRGK